jgi:ankyrin repeat protein
MILPVYGKFLETVQYDPTQISKVGRGALTELACYRDLKGMSRMLASGANPNDRDEKSVSALARAVEAGAGDVVRLLLKHGADAKSVSLLEKALFEDCCPAEVVELLLRHGANPNANIPGQGTALHVALDSVWDGDRCKTIVQTLLRHGANPNTEYNGKSPLAIAREEGLREVVALMTRQATRG